MEKYDDEIYKYLTATDNYKAAKTISDTLSTIVEPRLNKEFWDCIKSYLEQTFKKSAIEDVKRLLIDESVEVFSLPEWKGVSISRDNDDFGINIDLKLIDSNKVRELISEINIDKHLGDKGNEPWPCYFHNFLNSSGDYFNKLPETRETKISETVKTIYDYIEKSINVCNDINKLRILK